jgi:hypothetical protein
VISPTQGPVHDSTQQSNETDIHAPGGIRTRIPSKREAAEPRLRPRGHRDRLIFKLLFKIKVSLVVTQCILVQALGGSSIYQSSLLDPEDGSNSFSKTLGLITLHGVISSKAEIRILTVVKNSKCLLTYLFFGRFGIFRLLLLYKYSGVCYNDQCYKERMLKPIVFINKIRMLQRTRRTNIGQIRTRLHLKLRPSRFD